MITRLLTGAAAVSMLAVATTAPADANEFAADLTALAESEISALVADPEIIAAIRAQNAKTAGLDADEIETLDQVWRAEVGAPASPTIDAVLSHPASDRLRAVRDAAGGLFTEIFVMDAVGLNVAASDVTSDYWQGDEAKWQATYATGAAAPHIGEIELDESTQQYQSQVSIAILDPDTQAPIGAATVGVNVELLQ